ncbi:MAG: nucleoside monophosphate kinase [Patescibacteria group bacterium]
MNPKTFVFVGRSGCGKGTQVELLQKYIKEKNPEREIFYLETGDHFRSFFTGDRYSNQLANKIYKNGDRQPDFLAIWMWSHNLLESFKGDEHLIFDGITRSLPEATTFTTAMEFYGREVIIVFVNVSREWSVKRLTERGRADDKSLAEIQKRLDWFDKDSYPAIEYFKTHRRYTVLDINGEQSIEDVHKEILSKIEW